MTTASVTAWSVVSTLPKDAAGVPFGGLVRAGASVTPFTLYKGIGASAGATGHLFSHLAVGTHTALSVVGGFDVGNMLAGVYLGDGNNSASNLTPADGGEVDSNDVGKSTLIRGTRWGELVIGGIAKSPSLITGSQVSMASGVVYGLQVAGLGVTAGDTVLLEDNGDTKLSHVFTAANESSYYDYGPGGVWFGASIVVVRTISGGTASATLMFNSSPALT